MKESWKRFRWRGTRSIRTVKARFHWRETRGTNERCRAAVPNRKISTEREAWRETERRRAAKIARANCGSAEKTARGGGGIVARAACDAISRWRPDRAAGGAASRGQPDERVRAIQAGADGRRADDQALQRNALGGTERRKDDAGRDVARDVRRAARALAPSDARDERGGFCAQNEASGARRDVARRHSGIVCVARQAPRGTHHGPARTQRLAVGKPRNEIRNLKFETRRCEIKWETFRERWLPKSRSSSFALRPSRPCQFPRHLR